MKWEALCDANNVRRQEVMSTKAGFTVHLEKDVDHKLADSLGLGQIHLRAWRWCDLGHYGRGVCLNLMDEFLNGDGNEILPDHP
jgi:hypothetical protein